MLDATQNALLAKRLWEQNTAPASATIAELLLVINYYLANDNEVNTQLFFNQLGIELFQGVRSKVEMMQKLTALKEKFVSQKNEFLNQYNRIQKTKEIIIAIHHSFAAIFLKLSALQYHIEISLAKFIDFSLGVRTVYDPLDHNISFDELCKLVKENQFNIETFDIEYNKLLNSVSEMSRIKLPNRIISKIILELTNSPDHSCHHQLKEKLKQSTLYYFKKFFRKYSFRKIDIIRLTEALNEIYSILSLINHAMHEPKEFFHEIKQKLNALRHDETTKDFLKRLFTLQPNYFSWIKAFKKNINHYELYHSKQAGQMVRLTVESF